MPIDIASVGRIARLARLAVSQSQAPGLAEELTRVIALADRLAAAPLDAVEPMAHPHEQTLSWREDKACEPDRGDALLALAPDARAGLYTVPKVLE